jgi:hypothetical protein
LSSVDEFFDGIADSMRRGSAVSPQKARLPGKTCSLQTGMPLRSFLLEKVDRETDVRGGQLQAEFIHSTQDVAKSCNNLRDAISVEITSIRTISHPRYFLLGLLYRFAKQESIQAEIPIEL